MYERVSLPRVTTLELLAKIGDKTSKLSQYNINCGRVLILNSLDDT